MTNTDETTGLPELPDNQFWRVSKTHPDHSNPRRLYHSNNGHLPHLSIIEEGFTESERRFWGLLTYPSIRTETVVRFFPIISAERYAGVDGNDDLVLSGFSEPYVFDWMNVTAEDIAVTAKYIMEVIESDKEANAELRARRDAAAPLFGDYPPKTLKDN